MRVVGINSFQYICIVNDGSVALLIRKCYVFVIYLLNKYCISSLRNCQS